MNYMKKLWLCAFSLIAVIILFTGCEKSNNPMVNNPDVLLIDPPAGSQEFPIYAGQTIPVGTVNIWFTVGFINVLYQTTGDWYLTEFHAMAGTDLDDIPQHNGNPTPGHFYDKEEFWDAPTQEALAQIPYDDDWYEADELIVAAHCVVFLDADDEGDYDEGEQEETGWAGEEPFPGANWAKYTTVENRKVLYLPEVTVKAQYTATVGQTPSRFHIWNVPDGYDIDDGYFNSWCLDYGIYIYPNIVYNALLWSSYDPDMPNYAKSANGLVTPYDKINYLLNKHLPPYTGTLPITINSTLLTNLQMVFWYYRGYKTWGNLNAIQKAMVTDANANGVGFCPVSGQWIAVLIDMTSSVQLCFLIIDP